MTRRVQGKVGSRPDFTGGFIQGVPSEHCGTTGQLDLDNRLIELANSVEGVSDPDLLIEMLITAMRVARGAVMPADFKLMNRALKESLKAEELFYRYRECRKVAVFGSARTAPEDPSYKIAKEFSRRMSRHDFMTITGAGPGIMAAGNEGAGPDDSFGLNIALPFEAVPNPFIAGNPKLLRFNYFFTRKLCFVKEADAVTCFPGGFGTMDEAFETLTLVQTGKAAVYPLVMIDPPGSTYWSKWAEFVQHELLKKDLIAESDLSLFHVTQDVEDAVEHIIRFYRNFHSYRYVGDKLVIRMHRQISQESLARLDVDFADLLKSGGFNQRNALAEEMDEAAVSQLPRLVFRHRKKDYGRLRQLIDRINEAV